MKKVNRLLAYILGTCLLNSCSDFLKKDPLTVTNSDKFFTNESEANRVLIGCYNALKQPILSNGPSQSGNFLMWESLSDNALNSSGYESFDVVMRGEHTPSTTGIVEKTWNILFSGISDCNYFLTNLDKVPGLAQDKKDRMKAEALFLRAYYYNELTQLYGDLPIRLTPATLAEELKQPRSPKSIVVEQILKDVDFAIANLPQTAYTNGRPVQGSAVVLKTRVLLNNQKFKEAAETAWSLIGSSNNPFALHNNYSGIFFKEQDNNKEIMFSVQFKAPNDYHSLDQIVGSRMSVFPTIELLNAYEPNDPRRVMTILEPGQPWAYNPAGFQRQGSKAESPIPFNDLAFRKWVNPNEGNASGATLSDQHMVKMRYADLLLMYAEAMFEDGQGADPRALKALNDVRARPGVNMPAKLVLTQDIVRNERRVELAFEGLRYNDLVRWGIAEQIIPTLIHNSANAKRKFKSYYFPIPLRQMDIMKGIWDQNPGWQ